MSMDERARTEAERARGNRDNSDGRPSILDWRAGLAARGGRILGDERNVLLALRLAPELQGLARFNEFALRMEFCREPHWRYADIGTAWTDDDDLALQSWLQSLDIDVRSRSIVADCVGLITRESSYHPVREYLSQLKWDERPRLKTWLADYLSAQGPPRYLEAVGRCFLISIVARVMSPGCKVDHALVLEGGQGKGKSSAAQLLAIRPEWFCDDLPDLHSKDSALQLSGKLIVELSELTAIRRSSEVESVKSYISRMRDTYRPPYARRTITVPRQCVFIGTTNEQEYLRDRTGNRRFWPVRIPVRIDLGSLERDLDQLYAEAFARYSAGVHWHLAGDEVELASTEQQQRLHVTVLETDVAEYLARMESQGHHELSAKKIMVDALNLDPEASDFVERAGRLGPQVASAAEHAGWVKVGAVGRGANRRTVYRKLAGAHRGS